MRRHNEKHLAFIRTLPCICCGDNTATQAAHVRYSDARIAKTNPGVGQKPDDCFTLPLCQVCHSAQHRMNEPSYWARKNIDPVLVSLRLYSISGDVNEAMKVINARLPNVLAAG